MKSHKYWFIPKPYGYGCVPISWEGWVLTFVYVLCLLGSAYAYSFFSPQYLTWSSAIQFVLDIAIFTTLFLMLAKRRVRGGLQWRWGK